MRKEKQNSSKAILGYEDQYYPLFSENSAVMLLIDPSNGNIVDANKAACKFYGYSFKALTSMKIQNINTLSKEQVAAEMGRAKKLEQNHFLFEHRLADGTVKPVEVYSGKITLKDKPLLFSIVYDITGRKQSEEKLRLSSVHWEKTFNAIQDGITLLDTNQKIIQSNQAFLDIIHKSKKEALNHHCFGFVHGTSQAVEDCPFVRMKKSKRRETMVLEINNLNFEVTVDPILDDADKIIGAVHIVKDITKNKQIELELRGLADIIERSLNEIYIFRQEDLKFTYINPGALRNIGFSKEEMLTMTPLDIKPEVIPESFRKTINPLLTHEKDFINFQTIHQRKNGTTYPVDVYLQLGNFEGTQVFVAIIIDDTERKIYENELIKAKEKAEESDRLKSAFLANMSHEIRTPMNGILGFTELLKEPALSFEEQKDFIQTIEISGARMLNTINNIVDISKIESGLVNIEEKETNLSEKMEFVYKFFKPEVEKKGLEFLIENRLSEKDIIINTDNEKVYGILTNLIKNSVKFTNEGSIEFGCAKKGEYLEFFVKDTGAGISGKQKEFIFDRFRQGSDEINRKYEGSGLGLSIAKSYVEMLGGKIWVESEEGRGSTFYFTIPYNTGSKIKTEIISTISSEYKEGQLTNLKILIVEDDEVSYSLLSRFVQKISKDISHAITGIEAVEACKKNPEFDLILMDIRMPKMNGLEATSQIRQFNKDVVIIAQTAYGFESDCNKALEAGCNDYITKPINSKLLNELIRKHFNK